MTTLLLLHGALGSEVQFQEMKYLLSETFDVHTLNFTGHGGRDFGSEFTISRFSDDVLQYLNAHGITKASMFGYSMGGYVALDLARQHPDRIESIFILGTKFDWSPETAYRETKMLDPEKILQKVPAFANVLSTRHGADNWKMVLQKTAEMMTALGAAPSLTPDVLSAITNPVRVCVGDRDNMVSLNESIAAYRNLKNGSLLVLPETPHQIENVDAERLKEEITKFFSR